MKRLMLLLLPLFILGCLPSDVELVAGSTVFHCDGGIEEFDVKLDWDSSGKILFQLLDYDGYNGIYGHLYDGYAGIDLMAFSNFKPDNDISTGEVAINMEASGSDHLIRFSIWTDYKGEVKNGDNGKRLLDLKLTGGHYSTQLQVAEKFDPTNGDPYYRTVWYNGGDCTPKE